MRYLRPLNDFNNVSLDGENQLSVIMDSGGSAEQPSPVEGSSGAADCPHSSVEGEWPDRNRISPAACLHVSPEQVA